ncbi:hypothetical protein BpHYR1_035933 [Brachionus plicatilis]|uniref:Uncharacterized protein n=1 Tax=Brachionus plicatilis TaxID=10195 RepID=A0A3M7QRJ5_BRAPC|nr:hypothetical protein BpHYR1_035933 [Brachionus plicatilis]
MLTIPPVPHSSKVHDLSFLCTLDYYSKLYSKIYSKLQVLCLKVEEFYLPNNIFFQLSIALKNIKIYQKLLIFFSKYSRNFFKILKPNDLENEFKA